MRESITTDIHALLIPRMVAVRRGMFGAVSRTSGSGIGYWGSRSTFLMRFCSFVSTAFKAVANTGIGGGKYTDCGSENLSVFVLVGAFSVFGWVAGSAVHEDFINSSPKEETSSTNRA